MARRFNTVGGRRRNVFRVETVQKRHQSKKFYARVTLAVAAVMLLAGMGFGLYQACLTLKDYAFYRNKDFTLRTVEVQVQGSVSRAEVLRVAGVRVGQNIMALNLGDIRKNLKEISYVDTVWVERRLPSKLKIVIEERQPVARLEPRSRDGGELAQATYYIDADGYMMRPKPGEELKPLPVILGVAAELVQDGQKTDRAEILSALELLRLADYAELKGDLDLTRINVDSKGRLELSTRDQGSIYFRPDFLAEQVRRLGTILNYARAKGLVIRKIDLTPERNVPVVFANM